MRSKPVMLPVMRSLCRVRKRSMTVLRMRCAKNIMPETVMERLYCGCGQRPRCVDLCCRPRAALHCFAAIVLPLCFVNPHVLGEARRAFYHVPGRVLVRFPHRAGPLLPGRVQLSHVRYHGHDMGTQPYLTDEQVARIRGEEPAFDAECQAGRRESQGGCRARRTDRANRRDRPVV